MLFAEISVEAGDPFRGSCSVLGLTTRPSIGTLARILSSFLDASEIFVALKLFQMSDDFNDVETNQSHFTHFKSVTNEDSSSILNIGTHFSVIPLFPNSLLSCRR
jgi:hypothetical protein